MHLSYLYTPAMRVDALIKNRHSLLAQIVVVDMEDSTHLKMKAEARAKIAGFDFSPLVELGIEVALRINAISTYDGIHDLELVRSLLSKQGCPIRTVLLPMVRDRSELRIYRSLFNTLPIVPRLFSFIETIDAVEDADAIAASSDGLCFGQADLMSTMYSANDTFVNYARARLCVAAAKYKIPAIDTNSFEVSDMAKFEMECVAAKGYGFTGKAAIHPNQVPEINRVFSVSEETISRYQSIVNAYFDSEAGFFFKDGEIVAPPFVAKARHMLDFYKRCMGPK
ncbi:aldolase [bacterium]|nr:aldolase [bacterium]